jgi:YgiT-type zinc finger domain-containing protein
MGNADPEEKAVMKCTIKGCPGEYEARTIVHTVRNRGEVVVFDHVPAEVCSVCGDVLLRAETVRRIEEMLQTRQRPAREVPLYEYA